MHAIFLLLVIIAFLQSIAAGKANFGVDDWSIEQVSVFLAEAGANVPPSTLAKVGLTGGADMQFLTDVTGEKLGLTPIDFGKAKSAIMSKLAEVNAKPVDFWEWRAANRRLFDSWIAPLTNEPRALLIWMRFVDSNEAIEHINDEIDEINIFIFWFYWLFAPHYPLWQVASKFSDSHTYVDGVASAIFGLAAIVEIISCIPLWHQNFKQKTIGTLMTKYITEAVTAFVAATVLYYILWHIMPLFLTDIWIFFNVYVIAPCVVLFSFYALYFAILAIDTNKRD